MGIALVGISAILLVISLWPEPEKMNQISFTSLEGISGTLLLTQPVQIHTSETTEISLEITMDQNDGKDNPLVFLSKLEMDHVEITPKGEGIVTVDPNKPVVLNWQLTEYKARSLTGTLWLFLESSNGDKELILARPIELEANNLFGISYQLMRTISIITLLIALVLFLPIFNKK